MTAVLISSVEGLPVSGDALGIFTRGMPDQLWIREADREFQHRLGQAKIELDKAERLVARIEADFHALSDDPALPECPVHHAGCEAWA